VIVVGSSFEECFREHYASIVAYGTSLTGDRDTARDLAQEAFARLHVNWTKIEQYDAPGAWLRRVIANLAIDRHRSHASERRAVDRLRNRAVPQTAAPRDTDAWVRLVGELPPRQRAIVTLHYGEDMSVADIAELLDINVNTVKSALSKARDTLRKNWEESDA
jgi:RNA polymerase sigma-70 factor (sigma-E family)